MVEIGIKFAGVLKILVGLLHCKTLWNFWLLQLPSFPFLKGKLLSRGALLYFWIRIIFQVQLVTCFGVSTFWCYSWSAWISFGERCRRYQAPSRFWCTIFIIWNGTGIIYRTLAKAKKICIWFGIFTNDHYWFHFLVHFPLLRCQYPRKFRYWW